MLSLGSRPVEGWTFQGGPAKKAENYLGQLFVFFQRGGPVASAPYEPDDLLPIVQCTELRPDVAAKIRELKIMPEGQPALCETKYPYAGLSIFHGPSPRNTIETASSNRGLVG